jgi:hypothetical protein
MRIARVGALPLFLLALLNRPGERIVGHAGNYRAHCARQIH